MEDREAAELQALAVRCIVLQVLNLDEEYQVSRTAKAQQSSPDVHAADDAGNYLKWRQCLLQPQPGQPCKLVHMDVGDRREEYFAWRKMLLDQRFPAPEAYGMKTPPRSSEPFAGLRASMSAVPLRTRPRDRSHGSCIDLPSAPLGRPSQGHLRSNSTSMVSEETRASASRPFGAGGALSHRARTSSGLQGPSLGRSDDDNIAIVVSTPPGEPPKAGPSSSSSAVPQQTPRSTESKRSVSTAYEFSGMHYIFDHHKKAISSIRFAHEDKDLLAIASMDGTISMCSTYDSPAVLGVLKGHKRGVTDIDWSTSNDYLVSTSLDGSVRVWDVKTRKSIRGLANAFPCLACRFLPLNTNIFFYGTAKGIVNAINLSTGKCLDQTNLGAAVLCFEFEPAGKILFIGDDKGFVHAVEYNCVSSKFTVHSKTKVVNSGKGVTSLQYKSWFNNQRGVRTPQLIAACHDSTIKLCGVEESFGVKVQREFPIVNTNSRIRCSFCPLISTQAGACVVSGSEDMSIYIYNVKNRGDKSLVNKLQGHSAPVVDVSWNYDESLLASGDANGVVIVWKRVQMDSPALARQEV